MNAKCWRSRNSRWSRLAAAAALPLCVEEATRVSRVGLETWGRGASGFRLPWNLREPLTLCVRNTEEMKGQGSAHTPPNHGAVFRSPRKSSSSAASTARPRRAEDKINNPCKWFVEERLPLFKEKENAIKLNSQARDNETLGDNRRGWRAAFSPLRVKLHRPQTERSESFAALALEFVEKIYKSFISSLIRCRLMEAMCVSVEDIPHVESEVVQPSVSRDRHNVIGCWVLFLDAKMIIRWFFLPYCPVKTVLQRKNQCFVGPSTYEQHKAVRWP